MIEKRSIPFCLRAVVLFPVLVFYDPLWLWPWHHILAVVGMGITAGVGFVFMSQAVKLAPMAIVSPFHYTQLITGAILGFFLWDMVPSVWAWAGAVLIVLSSFVVAREAGRQKIEGADPLP